MAHLPDLHTAKKPDWETVTLDQYNRWQRLASKTKGWLTPGNAVTSVGNIFTGSGIALVASGRIALGLGVVAAGRIQDMFDGYVAHKTGTKSPLGEGYDAVSDKLQAAAALPVLAITHVAPEFPLGVLAAEEIVIAGYSALAKKRGNEIHPSRAGKLRTWAAWIAMGGFGVGSLTSGGVHEGFETGSWVGFGISAALGVAAIRNYRNDSLPQFPDVPEAQAIDSTTAFADLYENPPRHILLDNEQPPLSD